MFETPEQAIRFILGGNATVTLESLRTGVHFTYRIRENENNPSMYFVSVLTGSDNESDYQYMGVLTTPSTPPHSMTPVLAFRLTKASRQSETAPCVLAWRYAVTHLAQGHLPPSCAIRHEGKCGRCGRKLTVPSSIDSGFGPECAEKVAA